MRNTLFWIATVVALVVPNWLIFQKERLLRNSSSIYLRLAPVDPRSLMQGDYMVLRYAISNDLRWGKWKEQKRAPSGKLVLFVDAQRVGHFRRFYAEGETLARDELLLNYKTRKGFIWLGAESFFFQEGHARYYERAAYGELKVEASGKAVLVGLRNAKLERLSAPTIRTKTNGLRRSRQGGVILQKPPTSQPKSSSAKRAKATSPTRESSNLSTQQQKQSLPTRQPPPSTLQSKPLR